MKEKYDSETTRQVEAVSTDVARYLAVEHAEVPAAVSVMALVSVAVALLHGASEHHGNIRTVAECLEKLEEIVTGMKVSQQSGQILGAPAKA
jgi:hypothetical protein